MKLAEQFLQRNGPCLTSELAAHLATSLRIKPAAARQQVSRLPEDKFRRLAYITFPRNARFIYLTQQYGSPSFWMHLVRTLNETNSVYGGAIAAVRARDGVVPLALFPIICGAPIRQLKHIAAERVLSDLLQAKLLEMKAIEGLGDCVVLPRGADFIEVPAQAARARLIAEGVLISAVSEWLRNNGIVSYGRIARRDKGPLPVVSTTAWDIAGPSYLGGLLPRRTKKEQQAQGVDKPAFFAVDLLLAQADASTVRPFLRKCEALRSLRNVGPCLQMFVAHSYTKEANELLKQAGVIAATTRTLFGKDFADGLAELVNFFRSLIMGTTLDFTRFDILLSKFSQLEGAGSQLKGTLFEFIAEKLAAYEFRADHTYMNRQFTDPSNGSRKAEADVIATTGDRLATFIECKGTMPYGRVPDDQFSRWLQHNVPTIYGATRTMPEWANRTMNFEFWATAPLTQTSQDLFDQVNAQLNPNRYSIRVRLGDELQELCRTAGNASVTVAFEKHFVAK